MASGLYELGLKEIMSGNIDLENDNISALLIDTSLYTVDLVNHSNQDDIPDSAQIAEAALSGKTLNVTVFRASDTTFLAVPAGQDISAVILFLDTDYADTSTLIAYLDNATEFPITPDGTDVVIVWDTGANGIFKL